MLIYLACVLKFNILNRSDKLKFWTLFIGPSKLRLSMTTQPFRKTRYQTGKMALFNSISQFCMQLNKVLNKLCYNVIYKHSASSLYDVDAAWIWPSDSIWPQVRVSCNLLERNLHSRVNSRYILTECTTSRNRTRACVPVVTVVPRFWNLPAVSAQRGRGGDAGARAALAGRLVQKLLCENRHRNAQRKRRPSHNFTSLLANAPEMGQKRRQRLSYPPWMIARRLSSELNVALVLVVRPDHLQLLLTPLSRKSCVQFLTFWPLILNRRTRVWHCGIVLSRHLLSKAWE